MNASTFNGGADNPYPTPPVSMAGGGFTEGVKIIVSKERKDAREEKR
jgi:hypothetical protein